SIMNWMSLPQILGHCLPPGVHVQLAVYAFDMHPHGVNADGKYISDFLISDTLRQMVEHLALTLRELLDFLVCVTALIEILHHLSRDVTGHRRIAPVHIAYRLD